MVGILIELFCSWLLLLLFEKKSLHVLGFTPNLIRIKDFSLAFFLGALLCVSLHCAKFLFLGNSWTINPQIDLSSFIQVLWWDLKSVLTEELLFRGAILYILIQRFNPLTALSLSAISFGVYHWFSFGIFGNILPMFFILTGTGIMGFALALSFFRTASILSPLGLHLGWNFFQNAIFSKGPLGNCLLIAEDNVGLSGTMNFILFLIEMIVVPAVILFLVHVFFNRQKCKKNMKTN